MKLAAKASTLLAFLGALALASPAAAGPTATAHKGSSKKKGSSGPAKKGASPSTKKARPRPLKRTKRKSKATGHDGKPVETKNGTLFVKAAAAPSEPEPGVVAGLVKGKHKKLTAAAHDSTLNWKAIKQVTLSPVQSRHAGAFLMATGVSFLGGRLGDHGPQMRFKSGGLLSLYFPSASVNGAKLHVTCVGAFPSELQVRTTGERSGGLFGRALMTLFSPGSQVEFIVDMGTEAASTLRGIKFFGPKDEPWTVYQCTIKRIN